MNTVCFFLGTLILFVALIGAMTGNEVNMVLWAMVLWAIALFLAAIYFKEEK